MEDKYEINKLLDLYDKGDELEIRFGYFRDNYFKSYLSHKTISKLLFLFRNEEYTESYKTSIVCMYNNGIRRLIYDDKNYVIKKTKKLTIDMLEINVRACLSKENILDNFTSYNWDPKIRRRNTFISNDKTVKIDITSDLLSNGNYQNQCEVEFMVKPSLEKIYYFIDKINSIINS